MFEVGHGSGVAVVVRRRMTRTEEQFLGISRGYTRRTSRRTASAATVRRYSARLQLACYAWLLDFANGPNAFEHSKVLQSKGRAGRLIPCSLVAI
jgi:hypothetical protein